MNWLLVIGTAIVTGLILCIALFICYKKRMKIIKRLERDLENLR